MSEIVSKVRKKSTKKREKQVVRKAVEKKSFLETPAVGLFVVFVFWVAVMFGLRSKLIVTGWAKPEVILPLIGDSVYALIGLFAAGFYLNIVRPEYLKRNSRIVLLCLISLLSLSLITLLLYASQTLNMMPEKVVIFLLPLAVAPLLTTILIGGKAGFAIGVWTSLVSAILVGRSLPVFVEGIIVTAVASQAARFVRTRTKIIKTGIIIGLAEILCVLGAKALDWADLEIMIVIHQAAACMASGVLSAVVVLLVLPLFEHIFAITTDITLLEVSDFGHPLLRRLAIEAPGTYHHSLVVASLAQAAADQIGANSLEVRVCAYFHDIGKLVKPNFFAENIHMQHNPHDELPPSMSTLVITSHVKEGLSLALHHKLPDPVMRVIREHHGTSVLSFFHRKAKDQLEFEMNGEDRPRRKDNRVDDSTFRYPGPKPKTRESAIVCLADAVEAASRSLEKTTPGHIEGLVNDIIRKRLEDGQLDASDLKLSELTKVRQSFIFTLTTMLHGRIPYPKDESKNNQSSKTTQNKQHGNNKPDALVDEQDTKNA